ncbi:MAG: hypothetical protein FDZ70_08840, partial [Actinobacteria bacterium]
NLEAVHPAYVRLDSGAPTTTIAGVPAGWSGSPATLSLTATDSGSGVAASYYRLDGGAVTTYTGPFAVTAVGTTTVGYWSVDAAGRTEAEHTATVRIDTLAPVTTASGVPAGWASAPVTVTLSAADATSGVAWTRYRVGSGAVQTYTAPFAVSAPGTTTVYFWSADNAGNAETTGTATVRIDTLAPVTTASGVPAGWASAPVTVTLSAADATSGVAWTRYRVGSGAVQTYTAPFAVASEGTTTVYFWSSDNAGNTEATGTATARIDLTDPVTSIGSLSATWTASDALVFLTATDAGSGVAGIRYRLNGGAEATFTSAFLVTAEGTTTISYRAVDNAGRVEATKTATVLLDKSAPISAASGIPAGWSASAVTFSLAATDAYTPVAGIRYRLNGGSWTTYTVPVAVSAEGSTTLEYRSADVLGNTEVTRTATIRIDSTVPSTAISGVPAGWSRTNVTLTLSATDAGSGVAGTAYRLNGGASTTYAAPFAVTAEGTTTVGYWSTDNVGRTESEHTATVRIDKTAPVTGSSATSSTTAATVTLSPSDALSGLGAGATWYRIDGGTIRYGLVATTSAAGTHTVTYGSVDVAGNAEATKTVTVRVRGPVTYALSAGADRYATAIEISKASYPTSAATVLLATGLNYPDALGGGTLAGAWDCPLLLVRGTGTTIDATVTTEIRRLGASRVVILGGTAAVSQMIESQARTISGVTTVQRVAGATRYETADLVARETVRVMGLRGKTFARKTFVVTGANFADALIAAPVAVRNNQTLLLVNVSGMTASTRQTISDLGVTDARILDSGARVPASVTTTLTNLLGASHVVKMTAASAPAMSVAVGAYAETLGMSFDHVGFTNSLNFPDALAAGPLQAQHNSILLLTPNNVPLDAGVRAAIVARKTWIANVRWYGGPAAVPDAVRDAVTAALL